LPDSTSFGGETESTGGGETAGLLPEIKSALIQAISRQLKIKPEEIGVDLQLGEFGFDSIRLTEFGSYLNRIYDLELTPAVFFEYPTVHRLAEHLLQEHGSRLAEKLGWGEKATAAATNRSPASSNASTRALISDTSREHPRPGADQSSVNRQAQVDVTEPIAIIGLSGCFPGASDAGSFWENLAAEKDCIGEVPLSRWDWRASYGDPGREINKTNIKWGGFIGGVDEFDPLFFGISPREAEQMDPQQRLLMTHTWKAIEDAGYSAQSLSGSQTGIFAGTAVSGYGERIAQANIPIEGYSSLGAVSSVGPNRMSYFLDLHGPSEPIETACSSSLVAMHRAVRAIQNGDCDMALAGGVNTIISLWSHISLSKAGMLSEDGRCKTFSKDANGYVRGEGVGMLVLKKLSAAERDGDHIYGLIKGSAENHGGRANSLTAPNPKAQAELIKAAHRAAKIDPRTVTYIEAHGTGTPLGDPIEINGLKSAFADLYAESGVAASDADEARCGLGSVKTNIGHLELAAGIAGVIKVLLQFKHQTLLKSLHCEEINPYIELQGSPFYIVRETQPWKAQHDSQGRALPRRAGVSSFGFGGVNAHVILEEYVPQVATSSRTAITPEHPALIVLSARNEERLREQAGQLLAHLSARAYGDHDLPDIAYTLQVGREAMDHRLAFTATTVGMLQEKLSGYVAGGTEGGEIAECYRGEVRKNKEAFFALADDAEFAETIAKWIQRGKYAKLLELWTKGVTIAWSRLYDPDSGNAEIAPKRISLPTYPFAKERYWIEAGPLQSSRLEIVSERPDDADRLSDVLDALIADQLSIDEAAVKVGMLLAS
jgi:acyl transferase domain-containing protein/acyl carrier protein